VGRKTPTQSVNQVSWWFQVASDDDCEYGEIEDDDDQDKFSYQLLAVSSLARLVPDYSLPLLSRCVECLCLHMSSRWG